MSEHRVATHLGVAASDYDAKWGIDLGAVGQAQVRSKLAKALGGAPPLPFGDALEIGAGTGYFTLNLLQAGLIGRATLVVEARLHSGSLSTASPSSSGAGMLGSITWSRSSR